MTIDRRTFNKLRDIRRRLNLVSASTVSAPVPTRFFDVSEGRLADGDTGGSGPGNV